MQGAEFHRRPIVIQLRPPSNQILRLKAERLREDDNVPSHPFVEIIPAIRDLRRNRCSLCRYWISRHDGGGRNIDLSRIGVHPDLDDLTVGKLMGIGRVKYHMLIFVRILLINSLTVVDPDAQHAIVTGPFEAALHQPAEPLTHDGRRIVEKKAVIALVRDCAEGRIIAVERQPVLA